MRPLGWENRGVRVRVHVHTHSHTNTPSLRSDCTPRVPCEDWSRWKNYQWCDGQRWGTGRSVWWLEKTEKWALFFTGKVLNFPSDFLTQNVFPSKLNSVPNIAQIFPFSFYPHVCRLRNRNCIKIFKNSAGNFLSWKSSVSSNSSDQVTPARENTKVKLSRR